MISKPLRVASALALVLAAGCSSASNAVATGDDAATDTGAPGDSGNDAPVEAATNMCSAALAMILGPIDKVSTGAVTIVSDMGGVKTLYVDASAGGFGNDASNPRVYVDLAAGKRVDVTDVQAATSTAWDLAIKRPVIFTNSGDGGSGQGGVIIVGKAFDQVTSADATGNFATETFVDMDCNAQLDPTGLPLTTFNGWYNYDQATNHLTPKPSTTFVVRGGSGKLYKVGIESYYATPSGGTQTNGGEFLLQVAAL